jgi:hypothetical protein
VWLPIIADLLTVDKEGEAVIIAFSEVLNAQSISTGTNVVTTTIPLIIIPAILPFDKCPTAGVIRADDKQVILTPATAIDIEAIIDPVATARAFSLCLKGSIPIIGPFRSRPDTAITAVEVNVQDVAIITVPRVAISAVFASG